MYILKDLWYGKIAPYENIRKPDEYSLSRSVIEQERKLRDLLDEKGLEIYDAFSSVLMEQQSNAECDAFAKGFRLGAQIILEVMGDRS